MGGRHGSPQHSWSIDTRTWGPDRAGGCDTSFLAGVKLGEEGSRVIYTHHLPKFPISKESRQKETISLFAVKFHGFRAQSSQGVNTDSINKTKQEHNNTRTTKTYPKQEQNWRGIWNKKVVHVFWLHTWVSLWLWRYHSSLASSKLFLIVFFRSFLFKTKLNPEIKLEMKTRQRDHQIYCLAV